MIVKATTKTESTSAPFAAVSKDSTRHAFVVAVFLFLHVSVSKRFYSSIPSRDRKAFSIAGWMVMALICLIRTINGEKPKTNHTSSFTKAFLGLSILETLFTLVIPHALLCWDANGWQVDPGAHGKLYSVQDLLVPHLFVLQAQILLEMIICLTDTHQHLLFPYTAMANAYRLIPVIVWLQESARLIQSKALQVTQLGVIDITVLYVLPIMAMFLWVSSSFVFLPFIWYPRIEYPKKVTMHTHDS